MTMKKAEMEVVRFTESDVIVASSPVDNKYYANLANWGGATQDASLTITHNGANYPYNWQAIIDGEESQMLGNPNFEGTSLATLVQGERSGSPDYSSYNGNWVSTDGSSYTKQ